MPFARRRWAQTPLQMPPAMPPPDSLRPWPTFGACPGTIDTRKCSSCWPMTASLPQRACTLTLTAPAAFPFPGLSASTSSGLALWPRPSSAPSHPASLQARICLAQHFGSAAPLLKTYTPAPGRSSPCAPCVVRHGPRAPGRLAMAAGGRAAGARPGACSGAQRGGSLLGPARRLLCSRCCPSGLAAPAQPAPSILQIQPPRGQVVPAAALTRLPS